jgi:hypothetical protein
MAHSVVIVFATSVAMLLVISNIERRPLIRIRHDMEPLASA